MNIMKSAYIICSTKLSPEDRKKLDKYVASLEKKFVDTYYPLRDTDQDDETGYMICADNAYAISTADEVHYFWSKGDEFCLFELGVAFTYNLPLVIINPEDIEPQEGICTANMICYWSFESEKENDG
jgi:hypothetical protein